jgi:serine/threonine protein kinase
MAEAAQTPPLRDWDRAGRALERFLYARDLDASAQLIDACDGDPELAAAVRQILEQAPPFLRPDPASAAEGPRVFGDYVLLQCLGRGGMGTVYLAQQTSLKRQVALS